MDKQFRFQSPEKRTRKRKYRTPLTDITPEIANEDPATEPIQVSSTAAVIQKVASYEFSSNYYESERYFLLKEIDQLKEEIKRLTLHSFGFFSIANSDKMCLYYTGVHLEVFELLEKLCSQIPCSYNGRHVTIMPFKDQLFLTNLSYIDLGWRFGISPTTAFRVVWT